MKYDHSLIPATLIKRYKRFLADVILPDGTETTVYCSNTGKMTGCAETGDTVYLQQHDNPKRKYALSWELTHTQQGHWICVNTARANQVIIEAIERDQIPALAGYRQLRSEVRYGEENSRIDILLSDDNKADCYIEVKSCTLLAQTEQQGRSQGQGYFPDAVSTRGQKHLRELMQMTQQGHRAVLVFAVMHTGIKQVAAAEHIDKKYAELLAQAQQAGVEVIAVPIRVSPQGLSVG